MRVSLRAALGCFWLLAPGLGCSAAGETPDAERGQGGGVMSETGGSSGSGQSGDSASGGVSSSAGRGGAAAQGGGGVSGASSGSAGEGGAGGGTSAAGGGSPCGNGSIFCTDFEAEELPKELLFYPGYLRAAQSFITLDTSVFHAGKRALKVTGSDFSQMLGVAVPRKFWARVYLRSDSDIQEGHNTYVAAGTGTGDPNDGTYIRVGEHECQLELNRNTDDKELLSNGGQYLCEGGVKLAKDTWYCLELCFDGPGQETRVFVDGTEAVALHTTDWGSYDYKLFKLGFEKYHGAAKNIWYDDLAIASEQLHCL